MLKRVMYIAPRFHTNQVYPVKSLIKNGIKVKFVSQYSHKTENYEDITPVIMGYSPLFNCFSKLISRCFNNSSTFSQAYGYPPILKLISEIKNFEPNLVISRGHGIYSIISMCIAKSLGKKVVLYKQIPKYEKRKSIANKFIKSFITKYEMTPIKGEKKNKEMNMKSKNIFYIPLVIDKNQYLNKKNRKKRERRLSEGKVKIITVAEFGPRKQIIELLEIYNKLTEEYDGLYLTLIGNATKPHTKEYLKKVKSFVDNNDLNENVEIRTNLSHKEVLKEYPKYDIFILPSKRESAGYALLEAMASELAVICTEATGLNEYMQEGSSGYIFDENDFDELYLYLKKLVENPDIIEKFGKKNLELVENKYSPQNYYEGLKKMWESINK